MAARGPRHRPSRVSAGDIAAREGTPGKLAGHTRTPRLPLALRTLPTSLPSSPDPEYSESVTPIAPVLVVDDDAVSRHVIEQALRAAAIPCVLAATGQDGLDWLRQSTPSLLLLDLVMPPPDGYAILQVARADPRLTDLPIVVLTAVDSDHEVARVFDAGADDFVRKPFRPDELVARIRGQLRLRSYIEALARKEQDAKTVLELTQTLASSLDLKDVLFSVVRRIAEVARVDRCSIVLVPEVGTSGQVAATSDDPNLSGLTIDLTSYPEIREVVASRKPLVIPDTKTHELWDVVRKDLPADAPTSIALVPIIHDERAMGVLFLRARHPTVIGEHELSIAATIANATAIALRNARVVKRLRDRTERVTFARFKAERRLRLLKRYAAFFESGADGVLVTDVDWQILFSNAKARAITGFSDQELRARRFDELAVDADRFQSLVAGFQRGVYPQNVDLRVRRGDGEIVLLSINFNSVLRDDSATLLSFRDVTRERQVEAELKHTKEFLESVIGSSANAILSIDRSGVVRLFNRAAERIFGRTAEEVIGRIHAYELFPDNLPPELSAMLRTPTRSRLAKIDDHTTFVIGSGADPVPVSLSAAQISEGGEPAGAVVIFTDLRDKVRMEARLAAAQEQLQARERQALIAELAGAAAHELNQPLTSVMGYAELLKRKLDPQTQAYSAAEVIMNEAERMAEIVRKIGKITRYETKTYVGAARILDLDRSSDDRSPSGRR